MRPSVDKHAGQDQHNSQSKQDAAQHEQTGAGTVEQRAKRGLYNSGQSHIPEHLPRFLLKSARHAHPDETEPHILEDDMNRLDFLRPLAQLLLRLGLAIIFVYHGYPKLITHRAQWVNMVQHLGLPVFLAYFVAVLELLGGLLLVVGLFTRLVALLMTIEMGVAIWKVHLGHGVLAVNDYQLALAVGLGALMLAATGPGPVSVDRLLFKSRA